MIASGTKADGTAVELPQPTSRRVISEEASQAVVEMMESVVTLKKDRAIDGYRTIGKSGTAQRFDPKCKCYNGYTASYVGAARRRTRRFSSTWSSTSRPTATSVVSWRYRSSTTC
ncbi:penicillin-binding transpeptidase domain-containing protein [Tessaracoccus coleopterorum]|uniref:penicillin-binding transpeptidase domain-containing protein n=1 Tax=Tessaracoccus coleopterorum TaxID=2714950 RepID=UPI0038CDA778